MQVPPPHTEDGQHFSLLVQALCESHSETTVTLLQNSGRTSGTFTGHLEIHDIRLKAFLLFRSKTTNQKLNDNCNGPKQLAKQDASENHVFKTH